MAYHFGSKEPVLGQSICEFLCFLKSRAISRYKTSWDGERPHRLASAEKQCQDEKKDNWFLILDLRRVTPPYFWVSVVFFCESSKAWKLLGTVKFDIPGVPFLYVQRRSIGLK